MRSFSQEKRCPLERSTIRGAIVCLLLSSMACLWGARPQTETLANRFLFFFLFIVVLRHLWTLFCDKSATLWKEMFCFSPFTCMAAGLRSHQEEEGHEWKSREAGLFPQLCTLKESSLRALVSPSAKRAGAVDDESNSSLKSTFRYIYLHMWALLPYEQSKYCARITNI